MNESEEQSEKFLRTSSVKQKKSKCSEKFNLKTKYLTIFGIIFVLIIIISIFIMFWLTTRSSIELIEVNQIIENGTYRDITGRITGFNNQTIKNETENSDKSKLLHLNAAGPSRLIGHWKSIKSEGFDEYMKAFGIDFFRRKFAAIAETTEIITKDGDVWNLFGQIHIAFPVKVISELKFKEGEEFEYDTTYGSRVKCKFLSDGPDKLIQEDREIKSGKLIAILVREINVDDQLVTTMISGTVSAVKTYERVK